MLQHIAVNLLITIAEIDLCDPDPCQNGATCSNFMTSYNCTCPEGFTGENCEGKKPIFETFAVFSSGEQRN